MKTQYEIVSICGRFRSKNQDNFYLNGFTKKISDDEYLFSGASKNSYQLFAVCDGMGGEESGEVAAAIAVQNLISYTPKQFKYGWHNYIDQTNEMICNYQTSHQIQMGTTFAGLCINPFDAIAVNVGDSRIYRIREGIITQLSKDHNEYQNMVDAGIILDERTMRRAKSTLTQCLGITVEMFRLDPYVVSIDSVSPDDIYLVCSDGLYGVLSDEQILNIILDNKNKTGDTGVKLVQRAEERGSRDNITALIVRVVENKDANHIVKKLLYNFDKGIKSVFKNTAGRISE
ncbi:MAG: protein phosphatase 2C domain-containing protein [Lachnospiraceae bacterium]|nr:protein phosphatase 2C domain-containing protein [Lachnospiraceae bacterium]